MNGGGFRERERDKGVYHVCLFVCLVSRVGVLGVRFMPFYVSLYGGTREYYWGFSL